MTIRKITALHFAAVALAACLVIAGTTLAYETYHDPATEGEGYCADCHPGFVGRSTLHQWHQGAGDFTNTCNLCHTGNGRNNPLTMWSAGDGGAGSSFGCAGCHGRDYGETTENDINNGTATFPTQGLAKMSGYGLRKQHLNKGETICLNCHADVAQSFIVKENVDPPYYARSDVNILDACNTDGSEDTPGTEPNGNDTLGLDNDGDLTIDAADTDCSGGGATPGETSGPTLSMLLASHNSGNSTIDLTYDVACEATENNIAFGDLFLVSSYTYSAPGSDECAVGNSGSYNWAYPASPQNLFFLVVGNNATVEGSYGTDSSAGERPEDLTPGACPIGQDLTLRCD